VSNDLLQAGVRQTIDVNGTPSYYAWYEWWVYPAPVVGPGYIHELPIPTVPVSPGQTVFCQVSYVADNTAGYFFFGNEDTGKHVGLTLVPPSADVKLSGSSIEWIMECAGGGEEANVSLPKFSPVVFNAALGWGYETFFRGYLTRYGYPIVGDTLNIADKAGKILTSASADIEGVEIEFIG